MGRSEDWDRLSLKSILQVCLGIRTALKKNSLLYKALTSVYVSVFHWKETS